MKKLFLVGVLGAACLAHADQPLLIEQGVPTPIGNTPVVIQNYQNENTLQPKKFKNEAALNHSLMLEYSMQKGEFANDIDEDLKGFGVGYSTSPHNHGMWAKFEYQSNKNFDGDAYEFSYGGHFNLIDYKGFYTLITLGMGVSAISADSFDDSVYYTIPVGLELGYTFIPALSVYGGVGYKWAWDVSGNTRCNDGSISNNTGSGTCSWHEGIDRYNYTIGDFDGMTYKAGMRYNF